jgi:hypothetical protein
MGGQVAFEPLIPSEALPYLIAQKGGLDYLRGDLAAWNRAYRAATIAQYEALRPWLPATCGALLDVGSGLGGVDILIARHYTPAPDVWLLDGEGGLPEVERHNRPFSHMGVAERFLALNGVALGGYFDTTGGVRRLSARSLPALDLVVSFGSWGFHFPPSDYLGLVSAFASPGATVIVEVRRGREDWLQQLASRFKPVGTAGEAVKWVRHVFRA